VPITDIGSTPADWFPPERGPVLVVGNAGSVFTRHLAGLWRSMGLDARILTRRWHGERTIADGIPVVVATDTESSARRAAYDRIERVARPIEGRIIRWQAARYARAMGSETSYRPTVSPALADAFGIARAVRQLQPQLICGQEVFSYGLATAFSRGVPRVLMPWGGDIYMYAGTTMIASTAVRYALRNVDLVAPGSVLAVDYIHRQFGVPTERMHIGGTWALDRSRFRRVTGPERARICSRFGIDPGALIVMNVRRFFPAWGSDLALRACIEFARQHEPAHVVLLGGSGTAPFVAEARAAVDRAGLSNRFTLFDGDVSPADCAALMSVADIALSLMRELDMRPLASILEAAACGASPVLSDQAEYRAMAALGFRASFCPVNDWTAAADALRQLAACPAQRDEMARANHAYLDAHEDGVAQATALLRRIRTLADRT